MALAFDIFIDKDVVRRILASYYRPGHDSGPSWLTYIGHMKDTLWSLDLFRCESATLRAYWVLVVMDQYTRRIIGSAPMPEPSTVSHADGCSIAPFDGDRGCPSTSVPTMIPFVGLAVARQSVDTGGDRDQKRPPCSSLPSFCGATDRHDSTRVFGSHVILEHGRSGKQAARFPDIFQ
jgi:hypothetical protein